MNVPPTFELHPRLATDCLVIGEQELSLLLLMNDVQYPWFVLVPRRAGVTELHQLDEADAELLWRESRLLSSALMRAFRGDKLNVAAIGNLVPQLHVHHVVRFRSDAAWPKPVWGARPAILMTPAEIDERRAALARALAPGRIL